MNSLHLPLSKDVHAALKDASKQLNRPVTDIAREALGAWLAAWERGRLDRELARYVAANAGTEMDLDPDFEAASAEAMIVAEPAAKPRKRR